MRVRFHSKNVGFYSINDGLDTKNDAFYTKILKLMSFTALVLLFAQVGVHIVLVPEEDASSKHAAMEGLARVVNDNAGSDESMRSTDNATGETQLSALFIHAGD